MNVEGMEMKGSSEAGRLKVPFEWKHLQPAIAGPVWDDIIYAFCSQYSLDHGKNANLYPFCNLDSLGPCLGISKLSLICPLCTLIQSDLVSTDGLFASFLSQ